MRRPFFVNDSLLIFGEFEYEAKPWRASLRCETS